MLESLHAKGFDSPDRPLLAEGFDDGLHTRIGLLGADAVLRQRDHHVKCDIDNVAGNRGDDTLQ